MADANVYVRYLADASRLVTESRKASRATKGVGDSAKRADKSFAKFAGRAVTFFAGSAALAGMTAWVNEGTKMADTADLIRRSWDKTFTTSGAGLVNSLETSRKALGLAEFEMQQLLVTTGQLAQQQGLTKDESATFSKTLFDMAGDVAAFNGELDSAPEVLGAFQAALRGEFDPLEQYGVKLSQAAVNQRALTDSGKENVAELTDTEKQMAILALITDALGDEFGALADAIENGDTEANELSADLKDTQEAIGQTGQVIKRGLNTALQGAIDLLKLMGRNAGELLTDLDRFADGAEGPIGVVARLLSDLLETLVGVGDGAENMGRRFSDAMKAILSPIRNASGAVSRLRGNIGRAISSALSIRVPGFATGGVVPGQTGSPQLAVVHGGERVLTPAQQRAGGGGGGGAVYNITVNAGLSDPHGTAMAIVDLLAMYQRTQGVLPGEAVQQ